MSFISGSDVKVGGENWLHKVILFLWESLSNKHPNSNESGREKIVFACVLHPG